jgi:hypothetical protein
MPVYRNYIKVDSPEEGRLAEKATKDQYSILQ